MTYTAASDLLQSLTPDAAHKNHKSMAQKVIVVAMGPQVIADFADDFAEFSPKGSTVKYVLPVAFRTVADVALKGIAQGGNCKFSIQYVDDGNPASIKVDGDG